LLGGGTFLREWVDKPAARPGDLEQRLVPDEHEWAETCRPFLIY
jgi:hypothetical protein